jgi:hypothetical protein
LIISPYAGLQSRLRYHAIPAPTLGGINSSGMPWIPGRASLARNDVLVACSNQAATCLTVLCRADPGKVQFVLITQHLLKTVFFSTFVFFCRMHLL